MNKILLSICLIMNYLVAPIGAQSCEITAVTAMELPCEGNNFSATIDIEVENPASDSFSLAGNGVIYGTFAYNDVPVTVGPLYGDAEAEYEFIAWDIEDADCQNYTTITAADCGPICSIANFELEFVACVSNISAIVVIDFDYENPISNTFDLIDEDGEIISTWLYTSLPVTIPFFEVNGAAPIVLTVCDSEGSTCCETFVMDAIDCNPSNCEIYSVLLDPDCTGNNFLMNVDFGFDNPPSDSFHMTGNGLDYGVFAYAELPITVGPLNGGTDIVWEFIIADSENEGCNSTEVFGIYTCPPPCDVRALEAMALECNGNEAYSLRIGMDIEGEGDLGFAVFSETGYYGSYMYNELPLTLPAFEGSGEFIDYVSICDNEYLECCSTTPFEALLCAGCLIYNLEAIPLPCNDDDEIFVQIDFNYQNQSNEGFEITGNGENYGEFAYEDLPVQIGPFPGDGSQYFEFVVTDLVNPLCFEAVELGFVDCDTICELSNLTIETGDCTGHNAYVATIDFDYQGVSGVGFDVYVNGESVGFYDYDDLPLTIEDFPTNGTGTDTLMVCENNNDNCCATLIFDSPDCSCNIFDLNVTYMDCIDDSTFQVSLEYFYENLPGEFVDVYLNGEVLGFYNIDNNPITLNIPDGDGTAVLSVCANDLETCCDEISIDLMECVLPTCAIFDLAVEIGECTSDSTYLLDIVFESENNTADSINVYANGEWVGIYQIQPDFNRIENFPVTETDSTILVICAQYDPACCDTITYETPDCSQFNQCQISDLVAEFDECNSDTTYILHVDFNTQNLPVDSVIISANGEFLGQFEVTDGFIAIDPVPAFDSTLTTIVVCAVGAPDCCAEVEIETPDCSQFFACQISDLDVDFNGCTSDSTYMMFVSFNSQNLPVDSVTVTANGEFLGQFEVTGDPILFDNFLVYDSTTTTIVVCGVGAADCCGELEILTPDCSHFGQCQIWDLVAEFDACDSDSTYILHVDFNSQNLPIDSVTVTANGEFLGQFEVTSSFITINNVPAFDSSLTTIVVCAVGAPDCCAEIEIETPNCSGDCSISNIALDVLECNSDSTFVLVLNFDHENMPGVGFDVYAGDDQIGFYLLEQLPVEINNFPSDDTGNYMITICESDGMACCSSLAFAGPVCGSTDCNIFNLEYTLTECDSAGNFYFVLDFDFANVGPDGFDVSGNGNNYGNFSYDDLPIQIGPFPTDDTNYEFIVFDQSMPDCSAAIEPGIVDCDGNNECNIYDLVADTGGCNGDTTYSVFIHYFSNNLPSDSVVVSSGDNYYEVFEHNADGFTLTDFPVSNTHYTTITVCALGDNDCCDEVVFETPDCGQGFDCEIYDLLVEVGDCTSDTTFTVDIVFGSNSLPTDSVDIYANLDFLGVFFNDPDFIRIEDFPIFDVEEIIITLCAQGDATCCSTYTIIAPNCGSSDCSIFNLEYTVTECDSAGNFFFILDFDFSNVGPDGFDVAGNGNDYGNFSYDDLPIEIGPFPTDDTNYEFVVFDNAMPDCSEAIEPGNVNCFVSTAPIDFDEFFTIFNNGTIPGIHAKQPVELSIFNASGKNVIYQLPLSADERFELSAEPAGLYIATLKNGQNVWPVKLVKSGE